MINELRNKIADLALELDARVSYELNISADSPNDSWPNSNERHRIAADKYKTLYRTTMAQVLNLKKEDFVSES